MYLEEVAVGTKGLGRKCHGGDILAVAGSHTCATSRALYRVCAVHDYRRRYTSHVCDIAEVDDKIVVATILRAGLPFHQGFLNFYDDAENGFISAFRKSRPDGSFIVDVEYVSTSSLSGKTLILVDPMLATGTSLMLVYDALVRRAGEPDHTHFAAVFASEQGVDYVQRHTSPEKCTLWCAAVDAELTSKSYIVPGIGDAGDLSYGVKL